MRSLLCSCCCGSKPEQEYLRGAEDDALGASGELPLGVYAAMWCRSSGAFALEKSTGQIGARQRKAFGMVTRTNGTGRGSGSDDGLWSWLSGRQAQLVLSVTICTVAVHERHHLQRALELSASHPLLLPIVAVDVPRPDRFIVVRDWCHAGSLRDVIHGARPTSTVHDKYDRVGSPLSAGKCASIGRALVDALLVLRPLGARACLHVHCGNIFLAADDERPQLAEWEQGLLGLPSHLADFVNDLKRALEPAAASLALCLYEMACGFELDGLPAVFPPSCPRAVSETLEAMLRTPPPKERRLPRKLEDLLDFELFTLADVRERKGAEARGSTSAWPPPLSEALLEHARQVSSSRGDPLFAS